MKMNIIKLLIFVCGCMFLHDIQSAQSVAGGGAASFALQLVEEGYEQVAELTADLFEREEDYQAFVSDLSKERMENIVLLNDIYENYWQKNVNIFTKNNEQRVAANAVTDELFGALLENQTIICTKSLLKNFIYFANIWMDLMSLSMQTFKQKHNQVLVNMNDEELIKIQKIARSIMYFSLEIDEQFKKNENIDVKNITKVALENDFINPNSLYDIFFSYKAYAILTTKKMHKIYDIGPDYILFIPKSKVEKFKNLPNLFMKIYLGLDLSKFRYIPNISQDAPLNEYRLNSNLSLADALSGVVKNIFVSKQKFKKHKYFSEFLLPRFNIMMIGHGTEEDQFLGMNQNRIFPLLLQLNNSLWMKSLIIMSCHPGGHRFREIFRRDLDFLTKMSENLNYTIMIVGSFFSTVEGISRTSFWGNHNQDLNLEFYRKIFEYLSLENNEYQEVLEFIRDVTNNPIKNYGSIKFPNTEWIMANDYSKDVLNITGIKAFSSMTSNVMHIPDSKKIILLSTPRILLELCLDSEIDFFKLSRGPKILPMYYLSRDYFINTLRVKVKEDSLLYDLRDDDIGLILAQLFHVPELNIHEEKYILINEVAVTYKNQEKKFFKVIIDLLEQKIFCTTVFNQMPFFYCYNTKDKSLHHINNEYLRAFDFLQNRLLANIDKDKTFAFIQRLENLPTTLEALPKVAQESRRMYKQAQQQGLNVQARPFISESMKQSKKGLNPKAKKFTPRPKEVLSTFNPLVNPYAK